MTTVTLAPGLPSSHSESNETLSTFADPRSPLTSPEMSRRNSASSHPPELSDEVATLSNKLIHAINYQTDLDDSLNATRHELEGAQERVRRLERLTKEHQSLVANGILVRRSDLESDLLRLRTTLADERKQRVKTENEKKGIELELESLTAALFEEANEMVSAARKDARKEREPLERRNEQLQAKLNDAELLLASHQEQLAELKLAMQDMSKFREIETDAKTSTAPSTPTIENQDHMNRLFDALNLSPTTPGGEDNSPAPPTSFTHLLHPVLRMDVAAFDDFRTLLEMSRKSQPSSRVTSSTFNGLGLGSLTPHPPDRMPSAGSTSPLSTSNIHQTSPNTPTLPTSANSSFSFKDVPTSGIPLKETAFYKRALTEDIEPTLRLDTAPGLSWLARRTVISSMCEGKLIVEPILPTARLYHPPCTLCGEQGRNERHARTHRFRTSDSETVQRYPLCKFCLDRIRASCDFLGFLRMIKDGHWRTEGSHAELIAWEESVRLRERMFWARMGGGVIPAFLRARGDTPRSSMEEDKFIQAAKPDKPSPLFQETRVDPYSSPTHQTESTSPLPVSREVGNEPSQLPSTRYTTGNFSSDQPLPPEGRDSSLADSSRVALNGTPTCPRGPSSTESMNKTSLVGSVARRAAMFENTVSHDASSRQHSPNLEDSRKARSPFKGRSPSPAVRVSSNGESQQMTQLERSSSSIVPGSFDF